MKRGNRVVVDSSDEDSPSPNKATPPRRRLQKEREEEDSPLTPLSGSKRPLPAEHAARASLRRVLPLEDESEPQEAREQDEDDVVFSGEVTKQEKDAKALAEAVNLVSSEGWGWRLELCLLEYSDVIETPTERLSDRCQIGVR